MNSSNNKKVVILTNYELYFQSGAAFERMKCYSKALPDINFYGYFLTDRYSNLNNHSIRILDNLFFIRGSNKIDNYFYRNFLTLFDVFNAFKLCKHIKRNYHRSNTKILLYSSHFWLFTLVIFYLRFICSFIVVTEKNELELGKALNESLPNGALKIFSISLLPLKIIYSILLDLFTFGSTRIIVISRNFRKLYKYHPSIFLVPILVDDYRFAKKEVAKQPGEKVKLIYLGEITKNKDGLFQLLESIVRAKDEVQKRIEITIIGSGNRSALEKLHSIINTVNLHGLVTVRAAIPSSEVPIELSKFDFALLIRKSNLQTMFGLATKLGEYLAAGLPVITTGVSDNTVYLTEGKSAFFAKNTSPEEILSTITKIMNVTNLEELSINARRTAVENFSYDKQAKILREVFS